MHNNLIQHGNLQLHCLECKNPKLLQQDKTLHVSPLVTMPQQKLAIKIDNLTVLENQFVATDMTPGPKIKTHFLMNHVVKSDL